MNTEPTPEQIPSLIKVARPGKRMHIPNFYGCLFIFLAVGVLFGLALPTSGHVQIKGSQTLALAQAKQIGLALRLFAEDHDGHYPCMGVPREMTNAPADSNTAWACLFPIYTRSESIFGNKLSAYRTAQPDNIIDDHYTGNPKETLQPGENAYGYTMGLTDKDNPNFPLVMDGTDGTGHYNTNPKTHGGVWAGTKAVVIRLDNSGSLETLTGPDNARFIPSRAPALPGQVLGSNLLDFSHSGKNLRLLDPAVGPRRR